MKKLTSMLLALALVLSLAACGGAASTSTVASSASASGSAAASETAASDLDYIKEKGKMVIGYTVYEPMNYTDADGNFTGFDTELATAVCEKLGVEPEYVESDWDSLFAGLDAGRYDIVCNGVEVTDERAKTYDFTDPTATSTLPLPSARITTRSPALKT